MDSSKPQQSAPEVVRITVESVSVKDSPKKFGVIVCQIQEGVFVVVHEKRKAAEILWLRIDCGWIVSHGLDGRECYEPATMEQATRSWELEKSRRHRMAAAVAAMLVKSYTLANVKRFVRSIVRHTDLNYPEKPLVMLSDSSIEQIMISLGGEYGLKKQKVFEYIKVSATQQSNPPKSLVDIVEEIERIVSLRPTLWVKNNLNVLETEEMKVLNDKFVMAAAGGNTELFDWYLSRGQELTILHSELKYTALHAAADFGQPEIIARIISTGLSLDLKEPRKGQTALHCAAQSGRIEVLLQLRDAGADRRIMDNFGYKPYEIAHAQGYIDCREVVKLLTPKIRSVKVGYSSE